jgi:hypothetical protein
LRQVWAAHVKRAEAEQNRIITGHYLALSMERAKRPKKLEAYLVGKQSPRTANERKSPERVWADLEAWLTE